jgi:DNA-binding response OmpR family regulator
MKKILVVDDDPTSNTLVSFLLKTNGYESIVALDGDIGLNKVISEKPDLIVLDVSMPKMDGFTFLSELKLRVADEVPPVVMLTSKDNMQDVFKMEGVADYFVKPLDSEKFLIRIQEILNP